MEDIEYLEEYEDLVLPAINSAAAAAAASSNSFETNNIPHNQKINDGVDDSSSSLDQDIFNCLFDDNSDDDDFNDYPNSDNETDVKQKTESQEYFKTIDNIGERVIQKVEISRQDPSNKLNTIAKTVDKNTPLASKVKTFITKTIGTTVPLNAIPQTKSIATVRPTVQNQQQQQSIVNKNSNLLQRPAPSASSFIQRQNPSTSASSTSARSAPLPVVLHKQLSSATSLSSSSLISKTSTVSPLLPHSPTAALKKVTKRPATVVKPEKIITKDPVNDPLDLENISEDDGSDHYSLSDISGETYNSFSDFEDDESNDEYYSGDDDYYDVEYDEEGISSSSQIIELSNDSSGARSNLEVLRAPTPSPVISDDSETRSSTSIFKINRIKSLKPYSHPDIIESVLRKGEKPKLLELLHKYNLLEDSVENDEADNIIIDITTSRENLVESLDNEQPASLKNTLPPTEIATDLVNLNLNDTNKSLTSHPLDKNQTKNSKKTNKNKSKKKSVTNMDTTNDCRDLKSPGAMSTDSDLSAVEELLEESYAEAMKRVQNVPCAKQEVKDEREIGREEDLTAIVENKPNLPKAGVVIDYDVLPEKGDAGNKETIEQNDAKQKELKADQENKELKEPENLLISATKEEEKNNDMEINKPTESADTSLKQDEFLKENPKIISDKDLKATTTECPETTKILESVETSTFNSPNARKKKRFRNLVTPELTESETAKSIDDIKDFKGFEEEEAKSSKSIEKTEKQEKSTQPLEKNQEKTMVIDKDRPPVSFKSPSSSHQSLKDKSKEPKDKSSRDNSKESKDKSSQHSKSSKDRSSRESSRESSKDRSRESSKDSSRHSHNKDTSSKHYHRDHRKSSDSKDSCKSRESSRSKEDSKEAKTSKTSTQDSHKSTSIKRDQTSESNKEKSTEKKDKTTNESDNRTKEIVVKSSTESKISKEQDNKKNSKELKNSSESSKSGDSKEAKIIKTNTQDSHKSTSIKRDQSSESNREKSTEKKDKKTNQSDNNAKEIVKSSTEIKMTKEQDNKKDVKELKSSSDKKETVQKPKEKDSSTSLATSTKDSKQNSLKDAHKSSPASSNKNDRDSSKERKSIIKTIDLTKSTSEIKKPGAVLKNPKVPTDVRKSVTHKPSSTTSATADNVKPSKINEKPAQASKSSQENKNTDKILQKTNVPVVESKSIKKTTESVNLKDTPEKKTMQNPKTSSTDGNTSKAPPKSIEGDKKDSQKVVVKNPTSDSKANKMDKTKKDTADVNKAGTEKNQSNKIPTKSEVPNKTKTQTPIKQVSKEIVGTGSNTKRPEGSSTKPENSETKNTNSAKLTSENVNKNKVIVKTAEIKSKEKSCDFKKPKETLKNANETEQAKTVEIKNKEAKKISMSPKRSPKPKPKEEIIEKNVAANLSEAKKTDEGQALKSEKIKLSDIKTKTDANKTKDSKNIVDLVTGSEKNKNNVEKKDVSKSKSDVDETNKPKTFIPAKKEENVCDKQTTADNKSTKETKVQKEELKESNLSTGKIKDIEIVKKDASKKVVIETKKNKSAETFNKEQKGKETEKNKVEQQNKISETSSKEQNQKETEKNNVPETSNKEQKGKETEKNKVLVTPKKSQNVKDLKTRITEKNVTSKSGNANDQTAANTQTQITTNIDKIKDSKPSQKAEVPTNKSVPSSKINKKPQKQGATMSAGKTDPIETLKTKKQMTTPHDTSQKVKPKEITVQEKKIEIIKTIETEKLQDTCIEPKAKSDTNQDSINKDTEIKDVVMVNEKQVQIETRKSDDDLNEETKQHEGNDKISSDTKLEKAKSVENSERILKSPVLKKCLKNDAANESVKIRSIMQRVLEKSVVVLIEPLKSIPHVRVNTEDRNATEPRIMGSPKLNDSIRKDEQSKEKISENKESNKVKKRTASSTLEKDDEKKNKKTESEEHNLETMKARKNAVLQSDTEVKETSDVSQDNNLTKESKLSEGKQSIADDEMSEVDSTQRETGQQHVESKTPKKGTGHKTEIEKKSETLKIAFSGKEPLNQKEMEEENLKPIKTRKRGDIHKEIVKEKAETFQEESGDKKCSTPKEEKELISKIKTDSKQEKNTQERSVETLEKQNSAKIESEKHNIEPMKSRSRGGIEKSETSDVENKSAEKEADDHLEPIKSFLKEETEKNKNEISEVESFDEKSSTTEEQEPIKARPCGDLKEKTEILQVGSVDAKCSAQKEFKEEHLESVKTRGRVDLEAEAKKEESTEVESLDEKTSAKKENETTKTRGRGDIKEFVIEETEILQVDSLESKSSAQKEFNEEHLESVRTRSRMDLKAEAEKEKSESTEVKTSEAEKEKTEITEVESSVEKSSAKTENEPRKKRRRCDLNEETEKERTEILQVDSVETKSSVQKEFNEEHLESVRTRSRMDLKAEAEKEKSESTEVKTSEAEKEKTEITEVESSVEKSSAKTENEPRKKRRRCDLNEETEKERTEILQVDSVETKCSAEKELKEEHLESLKARIHGDLKVEAGKEKTERTEVQSRDEKSSGKKELQEEHFEAVRTRSRVDLEAADEKTPAKKENETTNAKRRGDVKEEAFKENKEILQVDSFDTKSSAQKELKAENLESVKTRGRGDIKTEAEKEKTLVELLDKKSSTKKENEPTKTSRRGDLKEKSEILEVDSDDAKCSAQKDLKEHLESVKTRGRADLKTEAGKEKTEITAVVVTSDEKRSVKKEKEPTKTRRRGDIKEEAVKQKIETMQFDSVDAKCSAQKELNEEHLESVRTRSRMDLKEQTKKEKSEKMEIESSDEKSSDKKENEPTKTRRRGGIKQAEKERTEVEPSDEKSSDIKENEAEHKKAEINEVGSSGGKNSTKKGKELINTKKRGDIKEAVKEKPEILQVGSLDAKCSVQTELQEELSETVKTRSSVDLKAEAEKEFESTKAENEETGIAEVEASVDKSSAKKENEPRKTRRRVDLKEDTVKEKPEILQVCSLDAKSSVQTELQEEHSEAVKTRSSEDLKAESEKEKSVRTEVESSKAETGIAELEASVDRSSTKKENEQRKTRRRVDLKEEGAVKEKTEILQVGSVDAKCTAQKELKEEHLDSVKTRRRGDVKKDDVKDKTEKSNESISIQKESEKEHCSSIKTRKSGGIKGEVVKEKTETSHFKSSDEKSSAQEDTEKPVMEAIIARRRRDLKDEGQKGQQILDQKEAAEIFKVVSVEKQSLVDNLKKQTEEQHFEPRRTRSRIDLKGNAGEEKHELSQKDLSLDLVNQTSIETEIAAENTNKNVETRKSKSAKEDCGKDTVVHSAENEGSNILQNDKVFSTADEKISEEMNLKVSSNESKQLQPSTALKTNSEFEKISEECVGSENEMSGCESSSSTSDNTFRRSLRKRGADSPLSENDAKKTFKEPLLKSTIFSTPKSSKLEKTITNVLSSSSKRPLRSPASELESKTAAKRPKLEISKKPTRFRNLHEESLEEKELPIVTAAPISKEKHNLKEQLPVLDKQELNESSTIVKHTSKNTAISEEKVEEKTPHTSTNALEKQLENEALEQPANKEGFDINIETNINLKKATISKGEEKNENVTNVAESTLQPRTNKSKVKTTPNKSSGSSAVISFSDWLKTQNQNITADVTNESDITKETTPRAQAKLPPKIVDTKLTGDKEKTVQRAEVSQEHTTLVRQDNEKDSALGKTHEKSSVLEEHKTSDASNDKTLEDSMDVSQQLDNSLLQLSENQLQHDTKQQNAKGRKKKRNVKRLQTSSKVSKKSNEMQTSVSKSNTPTITPPRTKRTETALLIDSMPKEMKDGGITDLLKTERHVKRQRLPNRRIISDSPEQHMQSVTASVVAITTAKETTLPNARSPDLMLNEKTPKGLDFSENLECKTTILISKDMSKSPTRRMAQQNLGKSRKSFILTQKDSSKRDITNTPDFTASIEEVIVHDDPKGLSVKSRKSLNIKDFPRQMEKRTTDFTTPSVVKSRKSMPPLFKESQANIINASSRKSLAISKQQHSKEQIELSESNVFKTPKQTGPSTIMNKIPSAASIKKLYAQDIKRPESRIKIQQKESLLKKFKCRKPYVRLDRSVVEKYFKQISSRTQTAVKIVSEVSQTPRDISPIIQNNSETNLRIQSIVDASTIISTLSPIIMTDTPVPQPIVSPSTNTFPNNIVASTAGPCIQEPYILPSERETMVSLTTSSIVNAADNEILELKHEFMDENPTGLINDAILPDTSTLLARAQTITEAAQHALSNSVTPTDIRLLTTDSSENNFVPSFGVAPRSLDNKGTCLYTFLHPAKYNRNHSNVLLDYCCPNLNGPMPAIDPTRIHAQVQVPIIELPASIVLTTKVVTRADLESGSSSIPSIIRKKAEKIRKNMATHHKLAVATTVANAQSTPIVSGMTQSHLTPLPPTINALTKQLPATTTITAKIRPPLPQLSQMLVTQPQVQPPSSSVASSVASALPKNTIVSVIAKGHSSQLSVAQQSSLRSNLRRFDVLLKQLVQPYESLSFVERHRIIEAVIASERCLPKDLEQTLVLMEEYIKQTMLLKRNDPAPSTSAIMSTNNYTTSQPSVASPLLTAPMPQLQPSPKILASNAAPGAYSAQYEQSRSKGVTRFQPRDKNISLSSTTTGSSSDVVKQRQVPIYDTDRNIIGYQMQIIPAMSTMPAYTKSTMSAHSGAIMSASMNSSSNNVTSYSISKRPVKRPAQDSPRVFYTTPPLKTSTPKAITNSDVYQTQQAKNANSIAQKTQGSIVTTVRSGGSSSSASSETITTTTTATVKRVTRSTATGSKIIILSKSNQSSEETILPDGNSSQQQTGQPEIKNEQDVEYLLG